ncbi:MAG TPA: hypothetical protein VJ731_04595 [Terriglobales bacterium]|nr:hypothetical protein [Terriglobales bacterium]
MGEIMEFSVKGCPSSFNFRTVMSDFGDLALADLENKVARPTPESTGARKVVKVLRLDRVEIIFVFLSEISSPLFVRHAKIEGSPAGCNRHLSLSFVAWSGKDGWGEISEKIPVRQPVILWDCTMTINHSGVRMNSWLTADFEHSTVLTRFNTAFHRSTVREFVNRR